MHASRSHASPRARRLLGLAVVPLLVATGVGLAVLWPKQAVPSLAPELGFADELVDGTVVAVQPVACSATPTGGEPDCDRIDVRLSSGKERGRTVHLQSTRGPDSPEFAPGDRLVLGHSEHLDPGAPPDLAYYFADYQRASPMWWLGLLFAGAVVALGRWWGVRALLALAVSLVLLVRFVLPAILEGHSPVAVAVVGAAAILVFALYLSHGVNARTTTAVLGTLASLLLIGLLAVVFVEATRLTGLSSEESVYLRISAGSVNLQGLLLGGIIIGSLGVLDDVTVTQAAAVWELHGANPSASARQLYRSALNIGRDHIASTVNTLVLAYAGASLPLLILFSQAQRPLGQILTGEVVAIEVVRTLVGSIGLVASVPITTALAAAVVAGASRDSRDGD